MPKNIENINPFHEEVHEDDARIFKNDKKHSFVPIEQAASVGEQDFEFISEDNQEGEDLDNTEEQERIDLLTQEIKFHQSEGVVSIGPDVDGKDLEEYRAGNTLNGEPVLVSAYLDSMNPAKSKTVKSDYELRKFKKSNKAVGRGRDNLKTLTPNKRQRSLGKIIKDFFTKQNTEETKSHKFEAMFADHSFPKDRDEPELNGKPMDKRLVENEEDKAA